MSTPLTLIDKPDNDGLVQTGAAVAERGLLGLSSILSTVTLGRWGIVGAAYATLLGVGIKSALVAWWYVCECRQLFFLDRLDGSTKTFLGDEASEPVGCVSEEKSRPVALDGTAALIQAVPAVEDSR